MGKCLGFRAEVSKRMSLGKENLRVEVPCHLGFRSLVI